MSDDFEQQDWVRFGVANELAKQYATDQRVFLERLASMLSAALPQETEVVRKGGLFVRSKPVQRIVLHLGENRYTLENPGYGNLQASVTRVVRGIALKTESLQVSEVLETLGAELDARAQASQAIREALARLVD